MTNHDLKCHPEHFAALLSGAKTAELRLNDRNYQVGDVLTLRNYDPIVAKYLNGIIVSIVTHIVSGGPWLADGYVMLSLENIETDPVSPSAPLCSNCEGTGQYLGHSADCDSDQCALNGDLYSCDGEMQFCHCEEGQALAKMVVRKP